MKPVVSDRSGRVAGHRSRRPRTEGFGFWSREFPPIHEAKSSADDVACTTRYSRRLVSFRLNKKRDATKEMIRVGKVSVSLAVPNIAAALIPPRGAAGAHGEF
jgi:hypothetical protein